ncbi:unnamed protein product [Macrosiphum euphorbiae]|uniref:Uncharacterized protein n=1 Tax=Macrosiphum euphorbiae TaxID=13131 RepID=A0AAV0WTC5_9HEMI|nr:unnamed protein product [Macrosiphum euphorbiae]
MLINFSFSCPLVLAVYEKIDDYNTTLRVSISKGTLYDGLSDMLQHPKVIPWNVNANLLMVFNTNRSVTSSQPQHLRSQHNRYPGGTRDGVHFTEFWEPIKPIS